MSRPVGLVTVRRVVALTAVSLTLLPVELPHDGSRRADATSPQLVAATGAVHDIGVGGALPTEAQCAARVVRTAENRPANTPFNNTRGSSPNNENPRVTGNFVGTTDEIIQWAACKWGLDVTWARHQAAAESFWRQNDAFGDFGSDPAACLPGHPIGVDGVPGRCPQSVGLLQVRYPYHRSAFENNNAIRSTAYNADYAWSIWRRCFEGQFTWLNTVERGRQYTAGDGLGCMGVWFAGRWYTDAAISYMNRLATAGASIPAPASGGTRPSAPRMLSPMVGYGVGSGRVRLTWTKPTSTGGSPITDYVIQRSWNRGLTWVSLSDGVSTNQYFVVSGLTNGATYWFRVAARNAIGWSPVSNVVSATPRATIPSAPRALTAAVGVGVGSGRVRLSWNAPSSTGGLPITDYVVQRSWNRGATWVSLSDGVSTRRTFTATGMTNGATYWFRVAARNAIGWGPVSNVVAATPRAPASTTLAATALAVEAPATTTTGVAHSERAASTSITSTSVPTSTSTTPTTLSTPTTAAQAVETAPPNTSGDVEPTSTTSSPTTTLTPEPAPSIAPSTPETVEPTTTAEPTTVPPLPPGQAPGCPAVSFEAFDVIDAVLARRGLTLAVATAGEDVGVRYIVGSIYDGTGMLVSVAETWVVIEGQVLALSDGANEHSDGLGDARPVLTEPGSGLDNPVHVDLAACAAAAVQAG